MGLFPGEGRRGYQMKESQPLSAEQSTGSGAPAHSTSTETARFLRVNHPTERRLLCWTVALLSLHLQPEPPTGAAALMTGGGRLTSMHYAVVRRQAGKVVNRLGS